MNRSEYDPPAGLGVRASWPRGTGLLVVGHGTADPVGAAETRRVAELSQEVLPDVPVELGFLEVIGPSIDEALGRLAAAGCREVVAAPLLLFAAGHAKRDVPEAIALSAAARGLRVSQAEPLGGHPAIVELSRRRRREAEAGRPLLDAAETAVVFIGRGSSDPTALSQMRGFATRVLDGSAAPGHLGFGFVAAARPTLAEALATAADPSEPGLRRIIVQPHLLFRGHVEEQVTAAVEDARQRFAGVEWVQVARLGADPLVARAIVDRAGQVCGGCETAVVRG